MCYANQFKKLGESGAVIVYRRSLSVDNAIGQVVEPQK
jgi:hypothetical protein